MLYLGRSVFAMIISLWQPRVKRGRQILTQIKICRPCGLLLQNFGCGQDAGAAQVRAIDPTAVSIFILSPDAKELRRRLVGRASEPTEKQNERYQTGKEQMKRAYFYDYVVMNDE